MLVERHLLVVVSFDLAVASDLKPDMFRYAFITKKLQVRLLSLKQPYQRNQYDSHLHMCPLHRRATTIFESETTLPQKAPACSLFKQATDATLNLAPSY